MKKNGFGDRLKSLLKQKGLTQAEAAKAVGTSIPSVNRWTKGGEIEYDNLRALADFLEVNWVWLRYGDEAIESLQTVMPDNNSMRDLRREYLDQILDSESRMKAALQMAEIVTWEWNVLTGSISCSDNASSVFGVAQDHLPNCMMPFADLPIEQLLETFGGEEPHHWDFQLTTDSQQLRWFTSRAELVFDAARRPIKIIGISVDITSRKQAEEELQRSEYMMKKIIEIIPVGLWVADANGTISLANPEVQRIWGGAKYVGLDQYGDYKGWWEKNGQPLGAEGWTLARAVKHGETSTPEVVNIEAFDGAQRSIIMHATPLRDTDDQIIGAIEVNQDITELKTTERLLKKTLTQWQAVFEQSEFLVLQLDQAMEIKNISNYRQDQQAKNGKTGPRLTDIFDKATHSALKEKLLACSLDQLSSFSLQGICLIGSIQSCQLLVINDERQDIEPMTLIFCSHPD